jgi:signal transduction histidine kinase
MVRISGGGQGGDVEPDRSAAEHAAPDLPAGPTDPGTDVNAPGRGPAKAEQFASPSGLLGAQPGQAEDLADAEGDDEEPVAAREATLDGSAPPAPEKADQATSAPGHASPTPTPRPAREPLPLMGIGARAWRQAVFELLNLPLGLAGFVSAVVLLSLGSGLAVTVTGLPLLAVGLIVCRAWGRVDRARARALLGLQIPTPSKVPARGGGSFGWLWARISDPVGWRSALYLLIRLPWAVFSFTVTLTVLVALWPFAPYVLHAFAAVDRALISAMLAPSSATERRIRELEAGRETMVDAAAADRRRIERDLHDGAQARLVALAMDLGLAKEQMGADPAAAARMVDQAHGEVKVALEELRNLARGIHPAILTERGLGAALANISGRCTVPVTVSVDLPTRPSAAVEGLLYFTTAELLTNISKHSGASAATVTVTRHGRTIELTVADDGRGGAVAAAGGGLAGLAERVHAMDGTFTLISLPGGPTVASVFLPWQDAAPARPRGA